MDAQQLGELLEPQYTYQEVSLEVFIKKLDIVFEEFRNEGDKQPTDFTILRTAFLQLI